MTHARSLEHKDIKHRQAGEVKEARLPPASLMTVLLQLERYWDKDSRDNS